MILTGFRLRIALAIVVASIGCQGASENIYDPRDIKEIARTCRIPATEKSFRILSSDYIEPDRLQLKSLRESAAAKLQNVIPELTTRISENSDYIFLENPDMRLRVNCPIDAPLWSYKMCARRLACAVLELVPDLSPSSVDRVLARSLTRDLDPHTVFVWGSGETCQFTNEGCKEKDAHVGMKIGKTGAGLTVMSVLPNSPAARTGVQPGDRLVRVNGLPVRDIEPEGVEWLLKGYQDTKVVVLIERPGDKFYRIWMTRKKLGRQKFFEGRMFERIACLRIREFGKDVAKDVKAWLSSRKNIKGFILDLRDNPGGLMEEAIRIADIFIDRGALMYVRTRDGKNRFELPATSSDTVALRPMIVLTNSRSASASEMLAGTLQDHKRALIVGQRTYGKGSMQFPMEIPGGHLLLTAARYLTGSGLDIQQTGINPDILLRPVVVSKRYLRLNRWPDPVREADTKLALSGGGVQKSESPKVALEYLVKGGTGNQDQVVRIAERMIKNMPWLGRTREQDGDIHKAVKRIQQDEGDKIFQALSYLGTSFGSGKGDDFQFEVKSKNYEVFTGRSADLEVSVTNTGTKTINGLSCHIETSNPFLADREMIFGPIAPGNTQDKSLRVYLPFGTYAREDPIKLHWWGPSGDLLDREPSGPYFFRIKPPPKPRVGLYAYLSDGSPGGNGDGKVSPGERIQVCARVKNFGKHASSEGFVSVDTRFGPVSDWNLIYKRFSPLDPGGEKHFCFSGRARKDFKRGKAKFVLRYGEWQGRILGARSLVVASEARSDKSQASAKARKKIWNPSLEVEADRMIVESESVCLSIRAWSNGESLRDVVVYLNDKKSLYRKASGSSVRMKECLSIEPGSSRIDVLVRNDSHSFAEESLFVYRM